MLITYYPMKVWTIYNNKQILQKRDLVGNWNNIFLTPINYQSQNPYYRTVMQSKRHIALIHFDFDTKDTFLAVILLQFLSALYLGKVFRERSRKERKKRSKQGREMGRLDHSISTIIFLPPLTCNFPSEKECRNQHRKL